MVKHQIVSGLPDKIDPTPFTCLDCVKNKSLRSITLTSSGAQPGPLDLVVSDVAGPYTPSANGARYMINFRDVATTYTESICIAKRDQVPHMFFEFVERLERQTGLKVKALRSDGAGEYTSKAMNVWCAA